ncbi:aminoglycoside phosphotransferase family protein [Streptomyces sp. NPDC088733]|uniref:aminoglycoside phosphotransferase family protein n=1 Tax=Streptomyces sp. NPDC088733 TaxID=3365880 RepID=UPI003827824F
MPPVTMSASLPLVRNVSGLPGGQRWLARLPDLVGEMCERWALRLGRSYDGGSCSWAAEAWLPDGTPAVLKVGWPHPEAEGDAAALRLWDGRGAVRVHRHDARRHALLLERCTPGAGLGAADGLTAEERLLTGAGVLAELWGAATAVDGGFDRLADVTAGWAGLVEERMERHRPPFDPGLVALGVRLLRELPGSASREVVVHGDFNPGNVLAATRRPWLAIDPKPMAGDPAYDPWPLLEQIDDPFAHPAPGRVLAGRFALVADALGEDVARLEAWAVARRVETALWLTEHGQVGDAAGVLREARTVADLAGL